MQCPLEVECQRAFFWAYGLVFSRFGMILPSLPMDLGLLLISIAVVNIWRSQRLSGD